MCQFDGNLRWKSKPKPVHYAFIHGNHYIFKWYFPGLLSFIFGRFFYVCFGECTCHYDHLLGFWWLCRLFLDVDTSFFLFCLNIFSLRRRKKKNRKICEMAHFETIFKQHYLIFEAQPTSRKWSFSPRQMTHSSDRKVNYTVIFLLKIVSLFIW